MYFMPYLCNQLGYKLEWGLYLYIVIHEESVFAIYASKMWNGNQLAAISWKNWCQNVYNRVQWTHYTIYVFAILCLLLLLHLSVIRFHSEASKYVRITDNGFLATRGYSTRVGSKTMHIWSLWLPCTICTFTVSWHQIPRKDQHCTRSPLCLVRHTTEKSTKAQNIRTIWLVLSEKWWRYSSPEVLACRIRRKCKQDAALCSKLHEAVWNDSPIRAKHKTARSSTAHGELGVSYKVFLRAWSSKQCPLAPSVHYNNAGNWKTTSRPLGRIHERKLLCDERCGWVHFNQGIEQENRTLKVIGGIVGITQNEKALDKFFLIAP